MKYPKLVLFKFDACPFCQSVISTIKQLKIKVEYKDIATDEESLKELIDHTGQRMVPCLYIDDKPMFESIDIIDWLKNHQNQLEKEI